EARVRTWLPIAAWKAETPPLRSPTVVSRRRVGAGSRSPPPHSGRCAAFLRALPRRQTEEAFRSLAGRFPHRARNVRDERRADLLILNPTHEDDQHVGLWSVDDP